MFKKLIAGIAATALALGMVALTATPASAATAWPAAKTGETCYTFDRGPFYSAPSSTQTNGPVKVSLQNPGNTGQNWLVASTGDPLATITILSNGGNYDRTGQTNLVGQSGSDIMAAQICTKAPPPPPPAVHYVTVAWTMPSWINSTTPSWPQQKFASVKTDDPTLGALDAQLSASVQCGQEKQWQIDVYYDNATTDSLVAGGFLNGPGSPPESLIPGGWGVAYKLVHIVGPVCLIEDATASVSVTTPDCRVAGAATFSILNATWSAEPPTAIGGPYTITAVANPGHAFAGGATTLVLPPYSIGGILDALSADCYNPKPVAPKIDVILHCGTYGSITLVDTNYIDYQLVSGDGQQGWNHVVAVAISPYVLKSGVKSDWWIYLGVHWNCPEPKASFEVGPCYADRSDTSYKNLKVTFDNTDSDIGQLYTIPGLGVVEWVPAGATETKTIKVPTSGSPSYSVYAGLKKVLTIDAIGAFEGCIGVLLTGDPTHQDAICVEGQQQSGSIWVDRKAGLLYTITNVTDVPFVAATLSGPGDGTTSLPPGDYEVTLAALPGYVLDLQDPATSGPWNYTIGAPEVDCDPPTLATFEVNVAKTDQTCSTRGTVAGTIIVGAGVDDGPFLDEVNYFINGTLVTTAVTAVAAGTYTVTAAPIDPADGLTGYPEGGWSLTVAGTSGVCDLTTLALTGAGDNTAGWAGLGYFLLVTGLALIAVRTVRRRNEVKQ